MLTLENANRGCCCIPVTVSDHLRALGSKNPTLGASCGAGNGDSMLETIPSSPSSSLMAREPSDPSAKTASGWAGDEGVSGAVDIIIGARYPSFAPFK